MYTNEVLISVIIPVYNAELYLEAALQSIQQQTYTNFECICVNDGSSDGSGAIIDTFVKNDKRFIHINRSNGGVSAARNTGLEISKGDYIYMMDHDDLAPSYTLEKLLHAALKYDADLSRGRMMMIPENFTLNELPGQDPTETTVGIYCNPLTDYYKQARGKNKNWFFIWMCLFKRSCLQNIRFYEALKSGGEDNLFIFDVIANINKFVQISDVVACHRFSKISTTLNGFNPALYFSIADIIIPYIHQKYLGEGIDKRLTRWVYYKQSRVVYKFLIKVPIRNYNIDRLREARLVLKKHESTDAFCEIYKRWNIKKKLVYMLFMKQKFETIKQFKSVL